MQRTPASLLERLRQPGDRQAWDRFVELYTPFLWSWATRMGLQATDAEDLIQEVFILLLRKMLAFDYNPGRSFRGWLRTVVLNQWRDRQRRRAPTAQAQNPLSGELATPDPMEAIWDEEYQRHVVARALELMRSEFEPSTWQACWKIVVEDRDPAAVAEELGITLAAAYTAKSRVLRRLRHDLQGMLE